jgi:hypothetical protein
MTGRRTTGDVPTVRTSTITAPRSRINRTRPITLINLHHINLLAVSKEAKITHTKGEVENDLVGIKMGCVVTVG